MDSVRRLLRWLRMWKRKIIVVECHKALGPSGHITKGRGDTVFFLYHHVKEEVLSFCFFLFLPAYNYMYTASSLGTSRKPSVAEVANVSEKIKVSQIFNLKISSRLFLWEVMKRLQSRFFCKAILGSWFHRHDSRTQKGVAWQKKKFSLTIFKVIILPFWSPLIEKKTLLVSCSISDTLW